MIVAVTTIAASPQGIQGQKVDSHEQAALIADAGMARAREMLARAFIGEITEAEVATAIEKALLAAGSSEYEEAFPPLVQSGVDSSLPHGNPENDATKVIVPGEVVIVDIGARYNGMVSDESRTFFIGEPTKEMRHVYGVVIEAQAAAERIIKDGATGDSIDGAARRTITHYGYGENFTHCTGHAVTWEVHAQPGICPGVEDKVYEIREDVITLEPAIYIKDAWGVRIEDDYAVLEGGTKRLTRYSRSIDNAIILPPEGWVPPEDLNMEPGDITGLGEIPETREYTAWLPPGWSMLLSGTLVIPFMFILLENREMHRRKMH